MEDPRLPPKSQKGLMWGWAGSGVIGGPLREWFKRERTWTNWEAIRDEVASELVRIDGSAARDKGSTECVVAGFVDQTPGILHVFSDGGTSWNCNGPNTTPRFIGVWSRETGFVWRYAHRYPPAKGNTTQHFCDLMRLSIQANILLSGFTAWQIRPDAEPKKIACEAPPLHPWPGDAPRLGGL